MNMRNLVLMFVFLNVLATTGFSQFVTNTTNITLSRNYTITDFETYHTQFYSDWGIYILGILAAAFGWIVSTSNITQAVLITAVCWTFIGFVFGSSMFFVGGAVLFIIAAVMKYITG